MRWVRGCCKEEAFLQVIMLIVLSDVKYAGCNLPKSSHILEETLPITNSGIAHLLNNIQQQQWNIDATQRTVYRLRNFIDKMDLYRRFHHEKALVHRNNKYSSQYNDDAHQQYFDEYSERLQPHLRRMHDMHELHNRHFENKNSFPVHKYKHPADSLLPVSKRPSDPCYASDSDSSAYRLAAENCSYLCAVCRARGLPRYSHLCLKNCNRNLMEGAVHACIALIYEDADTVVQN